MKNNYLNSKTLICFTSSYPFGTKETYFEVELDSLAKEFNKIILVPTYNPYGGKIRNVPRNVEVLEPLLRLGIGRFLDFIKNLCIPKVFISEFFSKKVYKSKVRFKQWFLALIAYGTANNKLKKLNLKKNEVIFYSYWSDKVFLIDPNWSEYTKVIRQHGADFYIERSDGYLPARQLLYKNANLLLPISKDIENKLIDNYKIDKDKVHLSYLGVFRKNLFSVLKTSNKLRIISCSNVYKIKRVKLIYSILCEISTQIKIEWIHIGSGDLFDELKEFVELNSRSNIDVKLIGNKSQNEIKSIYENQYFDFFINTSTNEGLPVSIMEAFSFGIPAIATDVGGTKEIVNEENGILIAKDFNISEIGKLIEDLYLVKTKLLNKRFAAFETWRNKFNAKNNYQELILEFKKV